MARDFREKLIRELELDLLCAPISRAVTATLVEYNRVHGTVYDFVGSGEDARGVDAIASSQRPGESALRFQVTLDFIRNKDFRANFPGFLGQIPYF